MTKTTTHTKPSLQSSLRGGTTKQSVSLIPKLRFKEFEGEWENDEFGLLVNRSKLKYNPAKEQLNLPCIELECLSQETGILLKTFNSIEQKSIKNRFKEGEILFGKLRPYLKKYLKAPFEGVCSSEIWVLKGIKLENDYLFQLIQTHKYNLEVNITSGSKMPRAEWEYISSVKFKYPKPPEQQKIANFLTAVDTKIQQLNTKKESLEQYKKGVMQQLFNQQLRFKPDTSQPLASQPSLRGGTTKQSTTNENQTQFPDWEEKKLGEVCTFFSGGTPTSTNKEYYSGEIPFIGSGNIYDSEVFSFISEEALNNSSAKIVDKGDLLYALYGANSGEVSVSKLSGAINQAVLCIRTNQSVEYLYYVLLLNKDRITSKYLQGGQGNLSSKIIKNLKYDFPSLPEQQKIANYLSAIDAKIETVNTQISNTQAFKKGLLQQMFV